VIITEFPLIPSLFQRAAALSAAQRRINPVYFTFNRASVPRRSSFGAATYGRIGTKAQNLERKQMGFLLNCWQVVAKAKGVLAA